MLSFCCLLLPVLLLLLVFVGGAAGSACWCSWCLFVVVVVDACLLLMELLVVESGFLVEAQALMSTETCNAELYDKGPMALTCIMVHPKRTKCRER